MAQFDRSDLNWHRKSRKDSKGSVSFYCNGEAETVSSEHN